MVGVHELGHKLLLDRVVLHILGEKHVLEALPGEGPALLKPNGMGPLRRVSKPAELSASTPPFASGARHIDPEWPDWVEGGLAVVRHQGCLWSGDRMHLAGSDKARLVVNEAVAHGIRVEESVTVLSKPPPHLLVTLGMAGRAALREHGIQESLVCRREPVVDV